MHAGRWRGDNQRRAAALCTRTEVVVRAVDGADAAPRAVTRAPAVGACSSTEPGVVTAALSGPLAENPPSAVHPKTW